MNLDLTFKILADVGALGRQMREVGRSVTVGLTAPLAALAAVSVKVARDIDSQVNTLRAFAGSAELAEKRLRELIATSQNTPGLTSGLALTLDANLRTLRVTEETINRILPSVGRLNAVRPLGDPDKFVRNLTQLVTQNFERTDLKELVGQSHIAGQLITEIFNVDSPINGAAIRKAAQRMGIRTVGDFFNAFADAASRNKGLQNVTESIGTKFDKMVDRVAISLRPLGLAVINAFTPIVEGVVPIIEKLGQSFAALPSPVRTTVVVIGTLTAGIGPLLFVTGSLISALGTLSRALIALNVVGLLPTIANLRLLYQVMSGTAGLAAGAAATAAVRFGALAAAIAAAAAVAVGLARAVDGYLESLKQAHPWIARFGQATLGALNPLYAILKQLGVLGPESDKVAAAQTKAVPAIKGFSDAVEEESRTLKQLKRDLAEVEIATRDRVAAAQRAYNEERISSASATSTQVQALLDEQTKQLALIDQQISETQERLKALRDSKPQGLGAHGAADEGAAKVNDDLEQLLLKRLQITSETNNQILDLRSQQRVKERQLEEQHGEALLSVQRIQAERQIEALRAAGEQNESLRLDSERKIVAIERRLTDAEVAEVRHRLEAAVQGTEARIQLEDELAQKLAERGRQRAEQARRVARAELEAALLPVRRESRNESARETGDEGVVARLRDAAELNRASFEAIEEQIGKIVDAGFVRRLQRLRDEIRVRQQYNQDVSELNAQLRALEQERQNAQEEADRAVEAGRQQDLERAQAYRSKLASIRQGVVDIILETRDRVLDIGRRTIELRRPMNVEERRQEVNHQADLAHVKLAARQASVLGELQDEISRLERKRSLNIQEVEQLKALHEQLRAEEDRFKLESEGIELQRTEGLKEAGSTGIFGALKDEWEKFKESIADTSAVDIFAGTLANIFGNLRNSVLGAVDAIIFSGKSIKAALAAAFKDALAQTAAFLAKKAFMRALEALAEAAMHFAALDFAGGARYLAAAAAWGALGAGVSALGKAIAGSGGATTGAAGRLADSSGGSAIAGEREDNRTRFNREQDEANRYSKREDRRSESSVVQLIVDGRELGRAVLNHVRDGGDLRDGFRNTLGYAGG